MRFGRKEKLNTSTVKTWFAWFPVTIDGETRWLEKVSVTGYYYIGQATGQLRFMQQSFFNP